MSEIKFDVNLPLSYLEAQKLRDYLEENSIYRRYAVLYLIHKRLHEDITRFELENKVNVRN